MHTEGNEARRVFIGRITTLFFADDGRTTWRRVGRVDYTAPLNHVDTARAIYRLIEYGAER
jgi:hypothetical protein